MILADFVVALVIALIFAAIISSTGRRGPGPGSGFLFFLLMFLLLAWAGGAWITPVGPRLLGAHWLNFFIVSLVVFLILGALIPRRPYRANSSPSSYGKAPSQTEIAATATLSIFVWVLAVALIVIITAYYL
jgi:hypothetical protein